ncbi:hypothetical protein CEQ90_08460 [Lewinellaceae bacterium SD302]|nr:hypothetical protein CEQ90_08460 [Lewinellaceae bacterium SD302]
MFLSLSRKKSFKSPAEKKRNFIKHFRTYLVMSVFFVVLNLVTSPHSFWAIWPIMGWGIGVAMEGLSVYGPFRDREDEYPEDDEGFFDLDQNRPDRELPTREAPAEPRGYREEDLI